MRVLSNNKGNILLSLVLTAMFTFIVSAVISLTVSQINSAVRQKQSSQFRLLLTSAIETFTIAVRHAEANYFIQLRDCGAANMFLRSFVEGHKCAALPSTAITVFTSADLVGLTATEKALFTYASGWQINYSGAATSPLAKKVLTLKVQGYDVDFTYHGSFSSKDRSDFSATVHTQEGDYTNQFSVFTSDSPNKIHLDAADSKLVAQRFYAKDPCGNAPWTIFSTIDGSGSCADIANLGGGTGLAYYHELYFGLRPDDGQIVSLADLNSSSYMVAENGYLGSKKVFPAYKKDALLNVDDIEVLGTDQGLDQIYAVSGAGDESTLSYYDSGTGAFETICKLGLMNMGRSYSGLSGAPGNQDLLDNSTDASANVASFYLKADNGDILTAIIKVVPAGTTLDSLPAAYRTTVKGRTAVCALIKDINASEIENARTLGLTRGGQQLRPYYIY